MEKWSIRPDPSAHDAGRFVLLIKGEMKHVTQVVKKFGAMCGRPSRIEHPDGFDYSIHLHGLTQLGMEKIVRHLEETAPGTCADGPPAEAPPLVQEVSSVAPGEMFTTTPPVETAPPDGAQPIFPGASPGLSAPPPAMPPTSPVLEPPMPVPPPVQPEAVPVEMISLAPQPPEPQAVPVPQSAPPPAALPPPSFAPTLMSSSPLPAAGAAGPASVLPLWGLREEIDEKQNFDSLMVGAYNRFAHAAATSVTSSPGTMYNPLFVFGVPGVGKTHMLHSIGRTLGKDMGADAVLMTTGAKLACAFTSAMTDGKLSELEEVVSQSKALMVDDVHLLSVSEKNQAPLAKMFQAFFTKNLQVVLTSVYPPRALGSLEEALKFSLAKGWAVDMKVPNPTVQGDMIQAFADRNGIQIAPAEMKKFVEQLGTNYAEFPRLLLFWDVLTGHYRSLGQMPTSDDIISDLLNPGVRACQSEVPTAGDLEAVKGFSPPAPDVDSPSLAAFCPKGQESMANWVLARFYQTATKSGIQQTYRHVLFEAYDADQPFGVPFQIGESCRRCGAHSALVLGPVPESKLATRLGEFSHAVRHILDSFGIAMGWIPYTETTITRPFLAAHLAFMMGRKT